MRPMALVMLIFGGTLWGIGCGERREGAESRHEEPAAQGGEGTDRLHVELPPEAIRNARIRLGAAGPAWVASTMEAPGEVRLDAERLLEVRPRFSGIVRELRKRVGDAVERGEVIAVVQSNESLSDYQIESSMAGTVISRPAVTGQTVDHETALFTIADLSSVWIDFAIYPQYLGRIRAGMPVTVVAPNQPELRASGTIHYVGPLLEHDTRVSSARIVLPNPARRWQPGVFVTARVTLSRSRVPVAVPEEAIIRMADGPAVFRAAGTRFELALVRLGRSDGATTEILEGLAARDSIVVQGAFLLKSELAKGEAEHDH